MKIEDSFFTRRDFVIGAAATAAFATLPSLGAPRAKGSKSNYYVSVLGDTHYDTEPESVYHSKYDYNNRWANVVKDEFYRNGVMWRELCPSLMTASAKIAAKKRPDFILQVGDLIQGDCGDPNVHKKMLDDCIKKFKGYYKDQYPFLTVIGNHDFRGKGARKAYFDFMNPYNDKEIEKITGTKPEKVRYPVFSFRHNGDLWVFCDFETKAIDKISELIEGAEDARHVFLVTHGPFVLCPSASPYAWRLAGRYVSEESRKRLYIALSRRRAIVLSGHIHTTTYYKIENEYGGFTEASVSSIYSSPRRNTAEPIFDKVSDYKLKGRNAQGEVALFKSGMKEFYHSIGSGHYRLYVADGGVALEFYPGNSEKPAKTFIMKKQKRS